MKKLIAIFGATAIVLTCFAGCGEKSAEELDDIAYSLYKAGNSSLTELDKEGVKVNNTFWFDSEKNSDRDLEFSDDLLKKISSECKDSKKTEWIIFFSGSGRDSDKPSSVSKVYVANDFESEPIAYYGDEDVDTEGKTLNDIKHECELKSSANSLYKAVNSALTELDENGIDIGGAFWFDSDKNISDTAKSAMIDSKDDFYNRISNFYADVDSCKWLVVCEDGMVDYAFASDDFDSETVSVYPEFYAENFKGLTLNEIKTLCNGVFNSLS